MPNFIDYAIAISSNPNAARFMELAELPGELQVRLAIYAAKHVGLQFLREFNTDTIYSPTVIKEYFILYGVLLICPEYRHVLTTEFVAELLKIDIKVLDMLPLGSYNIMHSLHMAIRFPISSEIMHDIFEIITPDRIKKSIEVYPPTEDEKMRALKQFVVSTSV